MILDSEKDRLIKKVGTLKKQNRALNEALKTAKRTIHAWHGGIGWEQYQHSPEMKKINQAINI